MARLVSAHSSTKQAITAIVVIVVLAALLAPTTVQASEHSSSAGLSGLKICVDPGHGGRDPGAVGYVVEKQVNLGVALKLKTLLEADGAIVVMTRSGDYYVSLSERTAIANRAGCNIFVSIHSNAAKSSRAHGAEAYYYPGSSRGSRLAHSIYYWITKLVPVEGRGVKTARFYVLRHTVMPAVLVELGFVTNYYDSILLSSEDSQWMYALAILYGIQEYFGVEPHNPLEAKPRVLGIRYGLHEEYARFVVDLNREPAGYTTYYWASPPYLIILVLGTSLGKLDPTWIPIGNGWYRKHTGLDIAPYIFVKETSRGVIVVIATHHTAPYRVFTLENPPRIVVDIYS